MITVMKFGGTSVGSGEALARTADIIAGTRGSKVVVVSAMSGVTNMLIGLLENESDKTDNAREMLVQKHLAVAREHIVKELYDEYVREFDRRIDKLFALLADADTKKDPYYKDNISSQGERLSSLTLSYILRSKNVKSIALTSEAAGIYAEGKPEAGEANLEKTAQGLNVNLVPLLALGVVPVITGFYGKMDDGRPLTFGRGGSDYSAAVVANALNADLLEIWTDVDGFMTADPRVVPDAMVIEEMNFSEAAELAYFGAKVLHPRTIEPVRMKHIPLKVRNSFNPKAPGTLIHHLRASKNELLRSVAMKVDLSIITVSSAEIAYRPRMVSRILEKIADANVVVYAISTSLSTIALLLHNLDVKETLRYLNTLPPLDIERIDVKSNVALVCAVGDNLLSKCGVSADIFAAVRDAGANVELISEGASDVSLNFVVPMDKATETVRVLHERFVGE